MLRLCTLLLVAALATALSPAAPVRAAGNGSITWQEDLRAPGGHRVNLVTAPRGLSLASRSERLTVPGRGSYTAPPRRLEHQVDRLRSEVGGEVPAGASVSVDVRGRAAGGPWTEWRTTPARLLRPVDEVQVRLVLIAAPGGATPVVSGLRMTAGGPEHGTTVPREEPLSFRAFATREGLVGYRTANGHVITEGDHFVSLPSGRALNPDDASADYEVKVCSDRTGRCETAPVWDVGPWNTRDDYWNAPDVREMWNDLDQGLPEAQAALLDGYNGGRDEFGREVANPAGIDLADGTFFDGLGLPDNDWIDVTYLWA